MSLARATCSDSEWISGIALPGRLNPHERSLTSGSVTRAAPARDGAFAVPAPRSDDAPQATAVSCRERLCGPDAESPHETTHGDGRDLPRAPRRALLQPLSARRPRQLGHRRPRRRGSRPPLGRGHRIRRHEHLWCARLAGGAPRERLATPARRCVGPLCGRLRRQRHRSRPRRLGPARRPLRPGHERRLLDGRRRGGSSRRHPGRLARSADRNRKRGRRAAALAAARDRSDRRRRRSRSRSSHATSRCPVASNSCSPPSGRLPRRRAISRSSRAGRSPEQPRRSQPRPRSSRRWGSTIRSAPRSSSSPPSSSLPFSRSRRGTSGSPAPRSHSHSARRASIRETALSAGIAFGAVELLTGMAVGAAGALALAGPWVRP